MTTPDPRDRAMDALLRRQTPSRAEQTDACPDAETLAAWMDGGLGVDAQAQVETHAAGCARCQALMAAIVKSDSATASPAAEPFWERWSWRWLVPLTAAAAAMVVWMIVPGGEEGRIPVDQEFTQARAEPAAPSVVVESPATATPPVATAPGPETKKAAPSTLDKEESDVAATRPSGAAMDLAARQATPSEAPAARADADRKAVQPVPADAPAPLAETVTAERERRSAEPDRPPAPAAPPPAAAAPATAQAQAAPTAGAVANAREAFADASTLAAGILSRDPAVGWRLAGPGVVERSTDGGASWTRLETGVAATFTSGSAPSASVCWLVGRGGLVTVTTDARTWRRGTSPTADDLVAVDAVDATTATVRTAAGRAFRTTDGGATWVATP